ncbi:ABC transporter permease subunit [Candidatus Gracilibacteria bacterium]|nr:ABC transporter permease subunit [Candidatus Gracilibacteria bacterium]
MIQINKDKFQALVRKELRLYFNSPIAYIFLVVFLLLSSWLFFRTFFLIGQTEMRGFFGILPWIFLFLIPSLTMRLWSEEYRQGTVETLLTSSVSVEEAVLGKAAGSFIFLALALLLTFPVAISLSFVGNLDWGVVLTAYFGALLLGMAYISLGLFISSLTRNQIVAFIVSVLVLFAFLILGDGIVTAFLPNWLGSLCKTLSLGTHYNSILRGVIDTRDFIFYLSFIVLFLLLNVQTLKTRR